MHENLTWDIKQALHIRILVGVDGVGEYWDDMQKGRRKSADVWLLYNRPSLASPPCPQRIRFIRLIDQLYQERREAKRANNKKGGKGLR